MAKKRIRLGTVGEWLEDRLKQLCGEISPDKRIVVTLVMLLLFAGLSLYMTFSSIYRFGKGEGERLNIRHIERLQLELKDKQQELDSLKQSKEFYDEYRRK